MSKKKGPAQVWLCTDCHYKDVHQEPGPKGWEWFFYCHKFPKMRKIRVQRFGLGPEVRTPKWCPFLKD